MADNMITFNTNDGKTFQLREELAVRFGTVKKLLDEVSSDNPVPLPQVNYVELERMVKYLEYLDKNPKVDNKLTDWEKEFCNLPHDDLFNLILASNYVEFQELLDVTCQVVAEMIKGKTVEEIRKVFGVENDFTPEEYEQVKKENEWIEEK